jgi:hypothetical protein
MGGNNNNMATVYRKQGEYTRALAFYDRARQSLDIDCGRHSTCAIKGFYKKKCCFLVLSATTSHIAIATQHSARNVIYKN